MRKTITILISLLSTFFLSTPIIAADSDVDGSPGINDKYVVIASICVDEDQEIHTPITYDDYDQNGTLLEETFYYINDGKIFIDNHEFDSYTYSDTNTLQSKSRETIDENGNFNQRLTEYYNRKGQLIKSEDENRNHDIVTTIYTYDDNGLIKCNKNSMGEFSYFRSEKNGNVYTVYYIKDDGNEYPVYKYTVTETGTLSRTESWFYLNWDSQPSIYYYDTDGKMIGHYYNGVRYDYEYQYDDNNNAYKMLIYDGTEVDSIEYYLYIPLKEFLSDRALANEKAKQFLEKYAGK